MAVDENEYKVNKKLKRFPKINELLDYDEETKTYTVIWNERNLQAITNIVKTVTNKHFMNPNFYEEYISHALVKVVDVLISGEFDYENYGTTVGLKNFLYTCARNSLTDYSYHYVNPNKEVFYEAQPESIEYDKPPTILTTKDIDRFLKYYHDRFYLVSTSFTREELAFMLKSMGYECEASHCIPREGLEYELEKCLSQFSKWYFKNNI